MNGGGSTNIQPAAFNKDNIAHPWKVYWEFAGVLLFVTEIRGTTGTQWGRQHAAIHDPMKVFPVRYATFSNTLLDICWIVYNVASLELDSSLPRLMNCVLR